MLLPVAVKAATCASYDSTNESYCVSMNDGGCALAIMSSKPPVRSGIAQIIAAAMGRPFEVRPQL